MDKQALVEQAKQLCAIQPGLVISEKVDALELTGCYTLNCSYQDIPLYDAYEVKIVVPWDYPASLPSIWEIGGKVPREKDGFDHIMSDDSLCLGVTYDLVALLTNNSELPNYICSLLDSYFYSTTYYREYGIVPEYGERPHGIYGIIESYKERYHISDDSRLCSLLCYSAGIARYCGHLPCPCGSGKRFRSCHGELILAELTSKYADLLSAEAKRLIEYYAYIRRTNEEKRRHF